MQYEPGAHIGPYELVGLIGEGAIGVVYRARDKTLRRNVALKVLRPEYASNQEHMARFRREARILASLNHPNIGQIYAFEQDAVIVMELVEGKTLKQRLERRIRINEVLRIATQIADAVNAAHKKGIVHRDLKPANIKLDPRTNPATVKVLDFGIARTTEPFSPYGSTPLTEPGALLGTPDYLSPEQARREDADWRSDIFSFGTILYEMTAGYRPFEGSDPIETMKNVIEKTPNLAGLPDSVRDIVERCLEKDPFLRYQTATEILEDLRQAAQAVSRPSPRKQGPIAAPSPESSAKVRGARGSEDPRKPMFRTFDEKRAEIGLKQKRAGLLTNLLLVPEVDLDAISLKIDEVVKRDIEPGVFGSYVEGILMSSFWWLKELRSVIRPAEWSDLILDWHRYLDQATAYRPDESYRFCGFSTILDLSLPFSTDILGKLVNEVVRFERSSPADVLTKAKGRADQDKNRDGGKLDEKVFDGIDVIASMIALTGGKEGLKPLIASKDLEAFLDSFFRSCAFMPSFGGAAGNQAFLYREMDYLALVHTPYNESEQATRAPKCAKRLFIHRDQPKQVALTDGHEEDPIRVSYVFNLVKAWDPATKTYTWPKLGYGLSVTRREPDRVIFRRPHPFKKAGTRGQSWRKLRVLWRGKGSWSKRSRDEAAPKWDSTNRCWFVEIDRRPKKRNEKSVFDGWAENQWPLFNLFQYTATTDKFGTLTIEFAGQREIAALVQAKKIHSALLGGIDQMASTVFTPALTQLSKAALQEQLATLSKAGVNMRFEFPGAHYSSTLDALSKIFHDGSVRNVSVNREELNQMTGDYGSRFYAWVPPAPLERQLAVFKRAIHFAKELGVRTVYVHDRSLDILVRRNTGNAQRDEDALAAHRQAMLLAKAAVAEGFYRRAGEPSDWSLVLAKQAMYELLLFSKDYAEMAVKEPAVPEAEREDQKKKIERGIRQKGFWRPSGANEFSVVVCPGIVLDLPPTIILAGAGDQTTAAQLAEAPALP